MPYWLFVCCSVHVSYYAFNNVFWFYLQLQTHSQCIEHLLLSLMRTIHLTNPLMELSKPRPPNLWVSNGRDRYYTCYAATSILQLQTAVLSWLPHQEHVKPLTLCLRSVYQSSSHLLCWLPFHTILSHLAPGIVASLSILCFHAQNPNQIFIKRPFFNWVLLHPVPTLSHIMELPFPTDPTWPQPWPTSYSIFVIVTLKHCILYFIMFISLLFIGLQTVPDAQTCTSIKTVHTNVCNLSLNIDLFNLLLLCPTSVFRLKFGLPLVYLRTSDLLLHHLEIWDHATSEGHNFL